MSTRVTPLRVRQDGGGGGGGLASGSDEHDGVSTSYISASLVTGSRQAEQITVPMTVHYGKKNDDETFNRHAQFAMTPMYPDEVRELITVLQHLPQVAGA